MPAVKVSQIASLLRENKGNVSACARQLGIKRTALQQRIARRPRLVAVLSEAREEMKDCVESVFFANCLDPSAQYQPSRFKYLFSQARDRGYVDKSEVELSGPGGGPIVTEVVIEHQVIADRTVRTVGEVTDTDPRDTVPEAIADQVSGDNATAGQHIDATTTAVDG